MLRACLKTWEQWKHNLAWLCCWTEDRISWTNPISTKGLTRIYKLAWLAPYGPRAGCKWINTTGNEAEPLMQRILIKYGMHIIILHLQVIFWHLKLVLIKVNAQGFRLTQHLFRCSFPFPFSCWIYSYNLLQSKTSKVIFVKTGLETHRSINIRNMSLEEKDAARRRRRKLGCREIDKKVEGGGKSQQMWEKSTLRDEG